MLKVKDIVSFINKVAPPSLAEDWDNVGLLVGSEEKEIKRIMVCLDVTTKVVEEAIEKKADMIVAHHPVIFKGLKRVTEGNLSSKLVYKLIRNDIAVFAAHTNFDVAKSNINNRLAKVLDLEDVTNLTSYRKEKLFKVAVYVPIDSAERVRNAICESGGGYIGNYSNCSFETAGFGTFMPMEGTNPYIGTKGNLTRVQEVKIETVVPEPSLQSVIKNMLAAHPYEEVAYDVYALENEGFEYGLGNVGFVKKVLEFNEFIEYLKGRLEIEKVRYTANPPDKVKKVAIFCGSFDEDFIIPVLKHNVDLLITGDLKHHAAIDLIEAGICAVDCGHYGTEKIVAELFAELLTGSFDGIEILQAEKSESPIITI